jgi:exopolysaccharide production protein ExoQ
LVVRIGPARSSPQVKISVVSPDLVSWLVCFTSLSMQLLMEWSWRFNLTFAFVLGFLLPWAVVISRQPNSTVHALLTNWALLMLPILAIMSTIWSNYSDATLRAGIQYLVTIVIGVVAGSCIKPKVFMSAFFSALLFVVILSILDGTSQYHRPSNSIVLIGVFGSKNSFSSVVAFLLLTAVAVAFDRSQGFWLRVAAVCAAVISPPLLAYGKSTGAIVVSTLTLAITFSLYLAIRLSPLVRAAILSFVIFVGTASVILGSFFADDFADVLSGMGKDVTLTGRTHLWDYAAISIAENPILGVGYQAYWQIGNAGAEDLWRENGITAKYGFNFHNIYMQIGVDLGWVGIFIFVALLIVITARIIRLTLTGRPGPEFIFATSIFIYELLLTPLEVGVFFPFGMGTFLLSLIWIYVRPLRPAPKTALRAETHPDDDATKILSVRPAAS